MACTRAKGAILLLQNVCSVNEPERTLGSLPNTLVLLPVGAFYDGTSETRLLRCSVESIAEDRTHVKRIFIEDRSILGGV